MFRVCFVSPEFLPISGGTGAYVYYLSRELARLGNDVHVITQRRKGKSFFENQDDVNVHYLKCLETPLVKSLRFFSLTNRKLKELDRELKLDLVHVNLPLVPNFSIPQNVGAALVATSHTTWFGEARAIRQERLLELNINEKFILWFNHMLRLSEKRLIERSDALIAVSLYTKKELLEFYKMTSEKVEVIHNGVDVQKFRPQQNKAESRSRLGLEEDYRLILSVGRLYRRKGLSTLLKAIPRVVATFNDVRFIVAGRGLGSEKKILLKLARTLKVRDYVRFIGYFPDELLPDLYAASDLFVLPALYEGFPFTILEAQACGLPVIATPVGGIPEYLIDKKNGLLVGPANPGQLAEAITTLLRDTDLVARLGEAGRERVEQRFTWPLIAKKVFGTYQRVLGNG